MATVSKWTPFGVALNITATAGTITRTSATQYTVRINASWESYYSGAATNYGMTASSGGGSATINTFGKKATSGSGSFTGTYSISGNGSASKTITVTFKNFNSDNGKSATKTVSLTVNVPAWTSYTIKYDANGGSGAPGNQTKWKDQTLTLSSTKPTRTGHSFEGWATSASGTVAYAAGAKYTGNAAVTLYAVWKANTYTVKFDANGGSGAPVNQTKTYGVTLVLSNTKPTRTNYNFLGWGTTAGATTISYNTGGNYTTNADITLYAIWELAYTKPRINSLSADRCDSNGALEDTGTYALVKFNWAIDQTLKSIDIQYKLSTDSDWSNAITLYTDGSSGSISQVIGGTFDSDHIYDIRVTVTDTGGYTTSPTLLPGTSYIIDILSEGKGIAFNKPAELEGVADMNFQFRPLAGYLQPILEPGTDLNNVRIPNTYTLRSVQSADYSCGTNPLPIKSGTGLLRIESFGEEGQVKQTIEVCHKTTPIKYERFYYQGEWGNWCEAGECKSAITATLFADVTLGAVNVYTQVPLNTAKTTVNSGLTVIDGGIKIGVGINTVRINGQFKINCGTTTGNRHMRICKNSGGTITYLAWNHLNVRVASDTVCMPFTPVIASVKEGDLIYVVFYTPDSTDLNYMGTSANGLQTYLTVESI